MQLQYLQIIQIERQPLYSLHPLQERRERHRQNYMHITIHTSQTWADTFISELNDTHVEAELRTRNIPPLVRPPRGPAGAPLAVRQRWPYGQSE